MVVTIETAIAPVHSSGALFLPLVVKHRVANLLESLSFSNMWIVGQVARLFSALRDCAPFRDWFFLRRLLACR